MDFKRIPWVSRFLLDMGLEDLGGNFWSTRDGSRSLYLGRATVTVITGAGLDGRDFETSYKYPDRLDEGWFITIISQHIETLLDAQVPDDLTLN